MLTLLSKNQSENRRMDPFSTLIIPVIDLDLITVPPGVQTEEEIYLVPGGRFIIVLSISLAHLTVIDVDRYLKGKSNKQRKFFFHDHYAVLAPCESVKGVLRASMSPDGNTLFIITSETIPEWYLFLFYTLFPNSSHILNTLQVRKIHSLGIQSLNA